MEYITFDFSSKIKTFVSKFKNKSGTEEFHFTFQPLCWGYAQDQLEWIKSAYSKAIEELGLCEETAIFRRFLCSDLINQAQVLEGLDFSSSNPARSGCAVSKVSQPPCGAAKLSLWAYHAAQSGEAVKKESGRSFVSFTPNSQRHIFSASLNSMDAESSYLQTYAVFDELAGRLDKNSMTLKDNVVRTWFYVQNVDGNYKGLVDARREIFEKEGLTKDTHFIASTGIEGAWDNPACKVLLDYYAIDNPAKNQIQYISAPEWLSPTHIYGVTFERATSIKYTDRIHTLISGTASIDKEGVVVHSEDFFGQFERTVQNIDALLSQAGSSREHLAAITVYLRDPSDSGPAEELINRCFPGVPCLLVVAPVCRPGWLVEIEGIAITPAEQPNMPAF
ncbi:pyrimidine utilization protein C [Sedimentisphaera cyanobacteriorum]|uniref:Pyrimidine utilization protein C n=1 Tax=Sedimentisphaera cyanobacteriorum TaxID=1940790 RepID=A0A1Q2HP35_9BACT|nr:Rid family hydrolase [Sedimentisphaera cyanobacteriorum]AQQ09016.1 pyrimidine utilization protein C [Sedimentisphaera cyanobacteriorum]